MRPEVFADPVMVQLGPLPITWTMATTALATALAAATALALGRAATRRPDGRTAAAARLAHRFLATLVSDAAGRESPGLEVFAGGLFAFIASSTLIGQLPGLVAPTSNLGVTSALALLVFLAVPVAGIRARGAGGYFKEYLRPNPLLLPLHIVSELSRTLALALRLFGNMLSGHLVVALVLALTGLFVPIPLMALDLLIGLLQAYIFTILACSLRRRGHPRRRGAAQRRALADGHERRVVMTDHALLALASLVTAGLTMAIGAVGAARWANAASPPPAWTPSRASPTRRRRSRGTSSSRWPWSSRRPSSAWSSRSCCSSPTPS
ncbi:MAG: F0F1 ATP synthase subunit A [Myxococcota bacterium]